MYEACVIGCGQIGMEVLKELANKFGPDKVAGVDIRALVNEAPPKVAIYTPSSMPDAKVYIISLWTMDSIIETGHILRDKNPALILIESTIDPERIGNIYPNFGEANGEKIVYFPHRFNPNDPEHHIFNQPRVLGSWNENTANKAAEWLVDNNLMRPSHVIIVNPEVAILSKVVENAYRAMEIIIAQELKQYCEDNYIEFEELRNACNTKWNIDIREARDGVKGKCLPKDLNFFTEHYPKGLLFRVGKMLNEEYIKSCNRE